MIHASSNSDEKQRTYGCSKPFLSTTLQIWCCCGHVIKSRTTRHLNFDCQLNLSKSHKVWSSYLVSFRRSVEKFGWGGGEKRPPPPCEIGLNNYYAKLSRTCEPITTFIRYLGKLIAKANYLCYNHCV